MDISNPRGSSSLNQQRENGCARLFSCGGMHSAAVTQQARVVCRGFDMQGHCHVPEGLDNVIEVSCGLAHIAPLTETGNVVCWGHNGYGQCSVPPELPVITALCCGSMSPSRAWKSGST
jgi:alpha-tubulin suppressor-like RCC1 family protein